jgi:hypothetical protein
MPTVYREDGFRIVIYPNDHLPRHVHVFKNDGEIIIQLELGNEMDPSFIDQIYGEVSRKEVAKALSLVQANQDELLEAWCNIHR